MALHLSEERGYRNTLSRYTPKHAVVVVRDWHPLKRRIASGAMAVMLASAMAVPAFAADSIWFDGDEDATTTAVDTDTFKWGGAGTDDITMSNYDGAGFSIKGDANIQLEGENSVAGSVSVQEGDLAITGNTSVPADNKPVLNINGKKSSDESYTYGSVYANGKWDNAAHAYVDGGDVTISGVTVNMNVEYGSVGGSGDVTIDNSAILSDASDKTDIDLYSAYGEMDIVDSVVTVNGVSSREDLTIDTSDVTAIKGVYSQNDDEWKGVLSRIGNVVLKNMKDNYEVHEYTWTDHVYNAETGQYDAVERTGHYVTTGSDDKVELKAASTPGYYTGTKGMPQTGDSTGVVAAGASAAALAAVAGMGLSLRRKHGKHEA